MISFFESCRIEAIQPAHDCSRFRSGNFDQDRYLRDFALDQANKQITCSYVAANDEQTVLGYYALSTASVDFEHMDPNTAKRLPHYPVAAALISHLAVDSTHAQRDLGEKLLIDALQRIIKVQHELVLRIILVSAVDNAAIAFYLRFGFIRLPGHSDLLFLPLETVKKALRK